MRTSKRTLLRLLGALLALAMVAGACGDDDEESTGATEDDATTEEGAEEGAEESAAGDLADCPNPMVFQTDWFPEPEHGALYNLTAGEGSIDAESGRFTGPMAADPSIEVEIRADGPFIGFQPTVALMATDSDIFMGYVNTDEAIANYAEFPTTAVAAPLDINPQIVMWDPETYDIGSWDDVKGTGAVVSHFAGASYTEYLVGAGLVDEAQLDGSYDGSPTRFIGEEGAIIQQGFATQEPYNYENVFAEWGKPVESLLIHDSGYELYQGPLAILDDKLDDAARSCLAAFVPVFQQSIVDFQQDPTATNGAILQAVVDLDSFWQLSDDSVTNTVLEMGALDIVGNGPDKTIGNFDMDRVNEVIKVTEEQVPSIVVPEGLSAEDLVTNEFIDPEIGL
ncbi:MAG: ABC transporter substrate-binding protein [Acidimicrobiales bacterium]